jgi:hypothetical protein
MKKLLLTLAALLALTQAVTYADGPYPTCNPCPWVK